MSKPKKPYWEMTTEELAEATREFDREHVGDTFRDMTPAEEKTWRTAVRKGRRPPGGRHEARQEASCPDRSRVAEATGCLGEETGPQPCPPGSGEPGSAAHQ
jgi:hypothetical protein